jgi:hypothetical protein
MKKGSDLIKGDCFKQYNTWYLILSIQCETSKTKTFTYVNEGIINYGSFRKETLFDVK